MSKIKLTGDSGGTGIFTIASPNSSTDRTITLPDDAGTIVTSAQASATSYSFFIDEDNMASDSATKVPSQQSVKAYVDAQIASENTLAEDNDVNITSAADGSLLLYDTGTSMWIDNVMSGDATMTDGGVISLAANTVDSSELVDGSVDLSHMSANSVDSDQYVDGSIDLAHMSANSVDSDQYVDGSIDTAHIAADNITSALIADDQIDSEHIVDGSIDLAHMSVNSIDSDQYVDGSIDLAHMSANSIDSDQYVDGSVDNVHLANSSITVTDGSNSTATSLGGTVTFAGTANEVDVVESSGTITYGLPTNVTIAGNLTVAGTQTTVSSTTIEVADPMLSLATSNNAADAVDIGLYGLYDTSGSQDLYGGIFRDASDSGKWKIFKDTQAVPTTTVNTGGTGYAKGTLVADIEGAVTGNSTTATALATGRTIAQTGDVVWNSGSFDGSANVTAVATIQADAVDSAEIADGAIDLAHMSANSVDSDQYVDGSIDLVHMSANSIDSDQYVDASIDLAHMSANSVDSDQYVDGSVDNVHLANSSVTVSDGSNSTAIALGGTATFSGTANEVEVGESSGTITIGLPDNVTIAGNLTVSGTQTTISSTTINVADPLLALATNNNAADAVDIGFYGLYDTSGSQDLYSGMFRDANDSGKWKLFKDTQAVPTTTVNTSGTGYAKGTLVADIEGNITGAVTGNATTATALATGRTIGMTGDVVWTSPSFDGSGNVTAAAALQANTVDSAELVDGSVDLSHMSVNSIDSDQYVDGSIDTAHIAADQITSALIADDQIDSEHIVDGSIDLAHMSVNSIDSDQYVDGSIDTAHIAADNITSALIADDQIDSEHIVDGSIDLAHMSVNSIDSDQYVDGSIDLAHMSANSVDSDQYVDGSVDNVHLANSSITVSDGSNTTAMALGSTVTFAGTTNEVNVAESSGTVTIGLPDNVTIAGNLTVSGTQTSVSSTTIEVADPLLAMATNNNAADAVDIGLYGLYDTSGSQDLYGGLFRDASDSGKWKLFKDNQAEPTTTVNTGGTGYAVGTLVANLEGNGSGTWTGNASTATALATGRTIAQTGDVVWSSGSFDGSANVTAVATIQADAVDSAEIASGAIDLDHMSANSVDSDQYVDGSIDLAHMSANSVDSDQYVDGSIDGAHIANDAVDSQHYAADSIDEEHIANDAVGSAELKSLATLLIINSAGSTVNTIYGAGA